MTDEPQVTPQAVEETVSTTNSSPSTPVLGGRWPLMSAYTAVFFDTGTNFNLNPDRYRGYVRSLLDTAEGMLKSAMLTPDLVEQRARRFLEAMVAAGEKLDMSGNFEDKEELELLEKVATELGEFLAVTHAIESIFDAEETLLQETGSIAPVDESKETEVNIGQFPVAEEELGPVADQPGDK